MRGNDGTFDGFIKQIAVLMPAIKELEAAGMSADDIAKLLELAAQWLRSREQK